MWIISEIGFFSIVQKPEDRASGMLTVRSRVRSDLDTLAKRHLTTATPITEHETSDYRYRVKALQSDVAKALASLVASIDYANFKSRIAETQGPARAHVYADVWHTLFGLQSAKFEMRGARAQKAESERQGG